MKKEDFFPKNRHDLRPLLTDFTCILSASSMGDPLPFPYPIPILARKLPPLLLSVFCLCSPKRILYLLSSSLLTWLGAGN